MKQLMRTLIIVSMIAGFMISVGAQEKIILAGTGDGQEVFEELSRAFEAANPGKQIEVPPTIDSSGGIRATAKGQCAIGRVARPPKDKEQKYNLTYKPVAHAPVVFGVHPSVKTVESITSEQALDILTGRIKNWKELGGPDSKIYVIQREKGDAARRILRKSLSGFKKAKELVGFTAYSAKEALDAVRDNDYTVGYIAYQAAKKANLKILKIDGIYPTVKTIQNGEYPFKMTLGFVYKEAPQGLAKEFIDYAIGSEGNDALLKIGAIPAI